MSHFLEAIFGNNHPTAQCEIGSIGWEDEDEYFHPGETSNDGLTLVKVQLFRGRDYTKELSDRAQGVKILCVLPDGEFRVPAKNARCYVMIPQGMDNVPGAGLIVATVGGGNEVHRNITAGDVVIGPTGDDRGAACSLVKKDGTITHFTTDNNLVGGQSISSRMGRGLSDKTGMPDGFSWSAPWGTLKFDPTGFHVVLKESGAEFHLGGLGLPAPLNMIGSYCNITAGTMHTNAAAHVTGLGTVQLANAQAMQAAITAIQTQLTDILGAIALITSGTPGATALTGFSASLTAATTALSAASLAATTTASADL